MPKHYFPILISALVLLLLPALGSAQAGRYPELARTMAKDGYASRQAAAVARIKPESMDANRQGWTLYEKKDYAGAIDLFTRALALDDKNVFARHNLACTLALAYGNKDPGDTPFGSRALLEKAIAKLLSGLAGDDIHWIYKLFLDPDLASVRGAFFAHEDWIPCSGDCCPDQWYTYSRDGTVVYGAGPTELSGLPGAHSTPTATANGWYLVIGDYVFVHVPDQGEILKALWPGLAGEAENGNDNTPRGSLNVFQIKRTVGQPIKMDWQTDLWEPDQ
jgi:tetratricopeptide (TPR) repeat protein